jgi:hypothetical protein
MPNCSIAKALLCSVAERESTMPRRKKEREDREVGYFLILLTLVLGIYLLFSGNILGLVSILASLILTIALFPSVGEVIKSILRYVEMQVEGRKRKAEVTPRATEPATTKSPLVDELLTKIQAFRPYKRPQSEKQLEDMLMQHLRVFYPSLRTQLSYERTQIDGQIERVGIELKYQPKEAHMDRLFGQVEKYSRHLDHVIVVIAYERSRESTAYFRKRLKRSGLKEKASVISMP